MAKIFPIDYEEKNSIAPGDFVLFSDAEDGDKIKKAQYSNLKGEKGDPGTAATITVGSTTTGTPGSSASVVNSGTTSAAVLDFTIPEGDKGDKGDTGAAIVSAEFDGDDMVFTESDGTTVTLTDAKLDLKGDKGDEGDPGVAATITAGTVTTLNPGESATVTNSGTSSAAVFNFGIPKGDTGATGATGNGISSITSSKVGKTTTVTITETNGNSDSFTVEDGADGQGAGDVVGPTSSTDGHLAVFDGVTGKLLKDGGAMPTIPTKVSDLSNDSGFITGIDSGDVTTALGYTPADSASLGTAATKNTGTSSGNVPVLDSNGKLANSTLPGVALTDTFTVSTGSDLTSLSSADQGDLAIVTSENKTYVLSQAPYSTASNWKQILSPTGGVTSVNGNTGAVTVSEFTPGGTATTGYVVKKTDSGYEWAAESGAVTSVNGQTGAVTVSEFAPSGTATTGYVVTKTASGYEWAAPTGGIQLAPNTELDIKYHWYGSQASYDSLNQYYTDTANDTAYFTI